MKHTNFEVEQYPHRSINRTNNLIVGFVVGVMVAACGAIYLAMMIVTA